MNKNIGVIGAGPAGILAAGTAASRGHNVILFDKNEKIGKKLFITGKGRCNITNASPIEDFFDNIISNNNFLYSSLYSFDNNQIISLLEKYGLKTKVERGNRVFPSSDKSSDVLKAFNKYLKDMKVDLKLNTEVDAIKKDDSNYYVYTSDGIFAFDSIILATGGASYPKTGSTGDGYKFAKSLGHKVVDLKPSLVPIEINEAYVRELQGLSLRNIELKAFNKGKEIYREFGEMIFTHYGISGPLVLSMSNHLHKYRGPIEIEIDLKPSLDNKKLDDRILRDFEKYKNKQIVNALNDLLPIKLIEPVLNLSDIAFDKEIHQVSREERERLLKTIKGLKMTFKSFRPIEEAIVTTGGVDVREINPSTMESRKHQGLFFAGELIDVDALTGGYNLQIAYSTGYLAGINV